MVFKTQQSISRRMMIAASILWSGLIMAGLPGGACAQANPPQKAWYDNPDNIPVTRWMDDQGRKPISYAAWKARTGESGPLHVETIASRLPSSKATSRGLFCIIVNTTLYDSIVTSLDQYMDDLTGDGYAVTLISYIGGTPRALRALLQTQYAEGMVGAVLIGDLPVAWYECDCWDPVEHEEFPCDLYYMDMDGYWDDLDADEIFDLHSDNVAPEIWVGRLTASPLTYGGADEVSLLRNYFRKNHEYRMQQLYLSNRSLVYVDDDWETYANDWSNSVGRAYPNRVTISDPYETTAYDYHMQLLQNYESVLVCVHSSPFTHLFKTPSGGWTGFGYDDMVDLEPVALFYNLFACSNARFVETDYMAGWYIFCPSYGLAAIGTTKTGSMLMFNAFYGPLGSGQSIGESFLSWFTTIAGGGMDPTEVCWHYGMTLCGDPTLRIDGYCLPEIQTASLPDAVYREAYEATLAADCGAPPYTWRIIAGELPKDLTFDSLGGAIAGIPDEAGDFAFTICVGDTMVTSGDTVNFLLRVTYTCGDADYSDAVNIADAVYLINYIFKSGPAPQPIQAGDADGSGDVNIGDAVYLIEYIFRSGPEPVCP